MVHWSVAKRRQCKLTLVDGEGLAPYAPHNLASNIEKVSKPIGLEHELLAPDRNWAKNCPLKGTHPCVCRDLVQDLISAPA
jgi:hypothetical protein